MQEPKLVHRSDTCINHILTTLSFLFRAKIIQVVRKDPETNRALEVQVYFIDRGFYEVVPSYNLFEIAPQFVDIPYQVSNDLLLIKKTCRVW